jgi:hypothetical protein
MELYPALKWSFNHDGTVKIEDFPDHIVERDSDWGWKISNRNISFLSGVFPISQIYIQSFPYDLLCT